MEIVQQAMGGGGGAYGWRVASGRQQQETLIKEGARGGGGNLGIMPIKTNLRARASELLKTIVLLFS
jgi:hypothetical protein